MNLCSIGRPI